MLNIIEGSNFVGKTTTLEVLKSKRKKSIYVYHPRFNDADNYLFNYSTKKLFKTENDLTSVEHNSIHVPRDVVYQISHTVCLKYLESFKDKNILLDRCFLSEMVYNSLYDKKLYEEFIDILKNNFTYKIYLLTCNNDEVLKNRIKLRIEKDTTKRFGIRVENHTDPETIEEKFNIQKVLNTRYINLMNEFNLNHLTVDTSDVSQKEVAKIILKDMEENERQLDWN